MRTLYANGWVVTMDDEETEHRDGWVLVDDTVIAATGGGAEPKHDERVDLGGAVVTPGLVNTHHHLYQTLTRARAQQADLFSWLRELYPVWARIDAEAEYAAARTGLAELALSGCTTVFDHHYVFPRGREGILEAEVQAARELGVRIVASRGSMDLGVADGGLPPDELVEELDAVLAETERLAGALHEAGPGARVQIAVAPCSPFSVTGRLMEESAALARRLGLVLHTHLAETVEEEAYCRELYGCSPVEYLDRLGWLDRDVWCAHCVHLSDARGRAVRRARGPASRTARPRTSASAPASRRCGSCVDAGVRVGLGVDGSASNERERPLPRGQAGAARRARSRRRRTAMTAREALRLATRGGAEVLRRDDIGSLEPGKQADLAMWRTDGLELGGADDLVAVSSSPGRIASTGSWSAATTSSEAARSYGRTRPRSRAPIGSRREDSRRERLALDPRARHRRRQPADGVAVELLSDGAAVRSAETDVDGRARLADELAPGTYRLVFHPPSPFFRASSSQVELADGHYHVPLLVSPFGCASYRGS